MDPRDLLRPPPDGAACTACGATVPAGRIRVLAQREDVAFVELACRSCGSEALGLLLASGGPDGQASLDVDADAGTEDPGGMSGRGPVAPTVRPAGSVTIRPVTTADVAAIRADLAAWRGDLVGWLDAIESGGPLGDDPLDGSGDRSADRPGREAAP